MSAGGAALVAAALGLGCLTPAGTVCEDGVLCPSGTACSPNGGCALLEQLAACEGVADGDACQYVGVDAGVCTAGVCLPTGCGNGLVEPGELCDDGGQTPGDGCAADCRSTEACGNGVPDVLVGEQCDCGAGPEPRAGCTAPNSDAPGAECRLDCTLGRCGDGVLEAPEECEGTPGDVACTDLGYYGGELGCSATCRFDVASCVGRCGDGVVNGDELCDGAVAAGSTCSSYGFGLGSLTCAACGYQFGHCVAIGWQPVLSPYGNLARGHSPDGRVLYAQVGGEGYGVVVRFDGVRWSELPEPPSETYATAWAAADDDVYLADGTQLLHFDGATWTANPIVLDGLPLEGSVDYVWASGADDVYLAGYAGLVRWNGVAWARLAEPGNFKELWGPAPGEVFAVGEVGQVTHCVADACTTATLGTEQLRAVHGSGPTDVWVADARGEVWRWDGASWTSVRPGEDPGLYVLQLWVGGPRDVWMTTSQSVLHFDGSLWSEVMLPTVGGAFSAFGVGDARWVAQATGDVWRAADAYWTVSGYTQPLGQIGDELWTKRSYGTYGVYRDGTQMDVIDSGKITGISPGVGDAVYAWGYDRHVEYFDGTSWTQLGEDTNPMFGWHPVTGLVARAPDDVYVGEAEATWHYDGAWTLVDVGACWGMVRAGTRVLAIARNDVGTLSVYELDGTSATLVDVPLQPGEYASALWAAADDDVVIASSFGTFYRWDGATWTTDAGAGDAIVGLGGTSHDDLFALTANQALLYFDGLGWSSTSIPGSSSVWGNVYVTPTRVVVGAYETIALHRTP